MADNYFYLLHKRLVSLVNSSSLHWRPGMGSQLLLNLLMEYTNDAYNGSIINLKWEPVSP